MHAASAPRAPYALGARGLAARGRAPSRYRRRAADARAKISGEGRDADSDAREAICSAREDEGAAETPTSTRQACVSRASTAFVAAATAATLALGASAPAPPSARFLRAEAAESAAPRPEVASALAAERERDRRAAERVVDAFLALSREDQIKVVDRLVFAADADRRAEAATRLGSSAETYGDWSASAAAPNATRAPETSSETIPDDPFAAADARDGWPAPLSDTSGTSASGASAARSVSAAKIKKTDDSFFKPASSSSFDDDAADDAGAASRDSDADDADDGSSSAPSSALARAGEAVTAGARTAAATAALRLSEAAPEGTAFVETFKAYVRDGAFPFPGVPSDAGVPLAFAALVALAVAPEIRNAAAGDAGDAGDGDAGDGTGNDDRRPNAPANGSRDAGVRRETDSNGPADPGTETGGALWSRRDEGRTSPSSGPSRASADREPSADDREPSASRGAPSASPGAGGVLWTRAEDDDAAAARRESRRKNARSRRSGGRNGLRDAPTRVQNRSERAEGTDDEIEIGGTGSGPPAVPLGALGLGPVEDENMENVRFSPRK